MVIYPNYGLMVMDWNPIINYMLFDIDSSRIFQTNSQGFISMFWQFEVSFLIVLSRSKEPILAHDYYDRVLDVCVTLACVICWYV